MNSSTNKGSSPTPILVFTAIVVLSVVFFFLFSLGSFGEKPESAAAPPATTTSAAKTPTTISLQPSAGQTALQSPAVKDHSGLFTTIHALQQEISARVTAADLPALAKLTGEKPKAALLHRLVSESGWTVAPEAWFDAGSITGVARRGLRLEMPGGKPAQPLMVDIDRTKTEGYKVISLRFSPALTLQIGSTDGVSADMPDPLDQAHRFFDSVLGHDFKTARSLTLPKKVTHEKLAGLCIVFEEGEYTVPASSPVKITAASADSAWAFVKVRSEKQKLENEVGLELERSADGIWRIHTLNFSEMLEAYVRATGTGGVFYSPIIKSAKGGESIVLYFDFDKAELVSRALLQLNIIAGLLKSDPARKMKITGHSDAVGSDDYNVRLSAERARNVHARLIELGVATAQIETTGLGSTTPLDANRRQDGTDNPEGRSRNRRTEIYLDF